MSDIVIEMLRFGRNNLENGFTKGQLTTYLTELESDFANNTLIIDLYFRKYFLYNIPHHKPTVLNNKTIYFLNPDGYFDLLQHESTTESSRTSKNSNMLAIISILIAIAAIGLSIHSILKTNDFVKIDQVQVKGIENIITVEQDKTTKSILENNELFIKESDQTQKLLQKIDSTLNK